MIRTDKGCSLTPESMILMAYAFYQMPTSMAARSVESTLVVSDRESQKAMRKD